MKIALKDFKKQFPCFFKRYRGGPNFNKSQRISYMLENYKVSLLLPICNPPKAPRAKIVNYPMSDLGWFEQHQHQIAHSKYIAVHESYWYYWPLIPTPFRAELGDLRLNVIIEKLPKNKTLPMTDDEFGALLLQEYNDYYNCETVGDYLLGRNTQIRNDAKHGVLQTIQSGIANGLNLYAQIAMILAKVSNSTPNFNEQIAGLLGHMLVFAGYITKPLVGLILRDYQGKSG